MSVFAGSIKNLVTEGPYPLTARRLIDIFAGPSVAAGVTVTPESAMTLSVVYACVRILSETLAGFPLQVFERLADKGRQQAETHPLYRLLHDEPNPWMTSFQFRETLMGHLALRGNAYAEIERDGRGVPINLWPLRPDRMQAITVSNAGTLLYTYSLPNGEQQTLPQRSILHIRGLSGDGITGYSPIQLQREGIGLALAAQEFGARFFGHGARPGGLLMTKQRLSEEAAQRLARTFTATHEGLSNSHRVAVLEDGVTWQSVGMTQADAQYMLTRQFQVREVARMFRIPPHKVGDLDQATFCLPGSSEVLTEFGPQAIREVTPGMYVWSRHTDGTWHLAQVRASTLSGYDRVLTIHTTNRTLRLNAAHRVLARCKMLEPTTSTVGGRWMEHGWARVSWVTDWVAAGELKPGDTILALHNMPREGSCHAPTRPNVSVGFMEFCGLLLGDGNISRTNGQPIGVQIARAADAPYMDHYRSVMREEFVRLHGNGRHRSMDRRVPITLQEQARQTRFVSVLAGEELEYLGLGGTARTKRVPPWVFVLNSDLQLAVLRGFLDSDGSVDKKGRVSYSSVNQALLSQIRHLCMMNGIPVTNLRCQHGASTLPTGAPGIVEQWAFTCSDPGENRRIWSHDPRYQERLLAGQPFGRKARAYPIQGGAGFDEVGCELSAIQTITVGELNEPVFDLDVADTHSFVADGVVVHNSNIQIQGVEFVTDTMLPWVVRWEQQITKDLFLSSERAKYFAAFNMDGIQRGDHASRAEFYASGRQWGWLDVDEIRQRENLNPLPDGKGQVFLTPVNMVPAGTEPALNTPTAAPA